MMQLEPYFYEDPYTSSPDGRPRYIGYIVDLVEDLASLTGFHYQVVPAQDGKFGFRQNNGHWDGMIGELVRKVCEKKPKNSRHISVKYVTIELILLFLSRCQPL